MNKKLAETYGKATLLSVGVDTYPTGLHFSNLTTCVNDAFAMLKVFELTDELNADSERLKILVTKPTKHLHSDNTDFEQPSRGNIILKLQELAFSAQENERLFFFFSGHGVLVNGKNYLVPSDAYSADDPSALIDIELIKSIVQESKARQKFIILDACMSGPSLTKASQISPKALLNLYRNQGIIILSSSRNTQTSTTKSPSSKLSLFTYVLVDALKGNKPEILDENKLLTLSSLYDYIYKETTRLSREYGKEQNPSSDSKLEGIIVIANFSNKYPEHVNIAGMWKGGWGDQKVVLHIAQDGKDLNATLHSYCEHANITELLHGKLENEHVYLKGVFVENIIDEKDPDYSLDELELKVSDDTMKGRESYFNVELHRINTNQT